MRSAKRGGAGLVLGCAALLLACGDEIEPTACDPLAMAARPIELRDVVAAGRDAAGTIYVIDEADAADLRVFVSDGDALQRHEVLGSGRGIERGGRTYSVSFDAGGPLTLYAEIDEAGETRMWLGSGHDREPLDAGSDEQELELLDAAELADLELRDLAPSVAIEYLGVVEDDRRVLVVRPEHDWAYEDFRLFLGPPGAMREHAVIEVVRARDGGSTAITFRAGGGEAELAVPALVIGGSDGMRAGEPVLELGGERFAVEIVPHGEEDLSGLRFLCAP